eukprot:1379849-Amphidinium_carterae.3
MPAAGGTSGLGDGVGTYTEGGTLSPHQEFPDAIGAALSAAGGASGLGHRVGAFREGGTQSPFQEFSVADGAELAASPLVSAGATPYSQLPEGVALGSDPFQNMSGRQISQAVDAVLQSANIAPLMPLSLPWESNHWLKSVLSEASDPIDMPIIFEPPENVAWPQPTELQFQPSGLPMGVKRRRLRKPWAEEVDDPRQHALMVWLRIIADREHRSLVGRQLKLLESDAERMESLVDTLAEKATGTIRIRALDFSKYLLWAQQLGVDNDELKESTSYQYMIHLRNSGAARTTLQRFLEAAAFAKHILAWLIEDAVFSSRRLKGTALRSLRDLPPVKRSQPFPPGFVAYLERLVVAPQTSAELKVLAGHILFLTHTRARFSDAQRVQVEPVIANNWLCTRTNEYKTSKARNRRGRSLPLLAVAEGYEHSSLLRCQKGTADECW